MYMYKMAGGFFKAFILQVLVSAAVWMTGNGSHFRGAIIQWRTVEDIVAGSDVKVEFTYRIGWRRNYRWAASDGGYFYSYHFIGLMFYFVTTAN